MLGLLALFFTALVLCGTISDSEALLTLGSLFVLGVSSGGMSSFICEWDPCEDSCSTGVNISPSRVADGVGVGMGRERGCTGKPGGMGAWAARRCRRVSACAWRAERSSGATSWVAKARTV